MVALEPQLLVEVWGHQHQSPQQHLINVLRNGTQHRQGDKQTDRRTVGQAGRSFYFLKPPNNVFESKMSAVRQTGILDILATLSLCGFAKRHAMLYSVIRRNMGSMISWTFLVVGCLVCNISSYENICIT